MTRIDTLDRLRAADPGRPSTLDVLVPADERRRLRQEIPESARDRARPAAVHRPGVLAGGQRPRPHTASPRRRRALVPAAALAVAAAITLAQAVGLPGTTHRPSLASAAPLLHAAGDQARGQAPVEVVDGRRVYSGFVLLSGRGADRESVSGEWWTDAAGGYLHRVRTHTEPAARLFGVPVGSEEWTRGAPPGATRHASPLPAAALAEAPTDAAGLSAYVDDLAADFDPRHPSSRVAVITGLLVEPLAPARLRGALFDLLATEPGAVHAGADTDRLGREGTLVDFPSSGSLLLDADAALPLELRGHGTRTFVGPVVVDGERTVPAGLDLFRLGSSA